MNEETTAGVEVSRRRGTGWGIGEAPPCLHGLVIGSAPDRAAQAHLMPLTQPQVGVNKTQQH